MVATRSTRSSRPNYREKQESDLKADVWDSDSSSDSDDEPVWLKDGSLSDGQDVNLSSDEEEEDGELNDLIDANVARLKDSKDREKSGEPESVDDATISLKLNKLQEFVQQSQVYSGIIAETLLNNSQKRPEADGEAPTKKRKTITDFFGKKDSKQLLSNVEQQFTHQQPSLLRGCQLKSYQLEGVNWLITLYENGLNGILADEMGLGKTLQSIALLAFITEMDTKGPFLIAAPLSTVDTWIGEFARFAPDIDVLKHYDTQGQQKRASKIKSFFKRTKGEGVVITSYEMIIRDIDLILSYHWKFLIVDEGHRIKNINCKLIQELKRINTSNRLLLTGTPLQNNLAELWSLLNFILPDIFADFEIFHKWFDFGDIELQSSSQGLNKLINEELEKNLISNLHTILKPFLLRRLKSVVLANTLPPKREYLINCQLTPLQRKFYKGALNNKLKQTVFKRAIKDFFTLNQDHIGQVSNKTIRKFMEWKASDREIDIEDKLLLQMEQLYREHIHRALLNKSLLNSMVQLRQVVDSTLLFFFPFIDPSQLTLDLLLETSGKLQMLQQLVPPLIQKKHKVLIFTQFVTMLDLLEDWCELNSISACRIDGSMDNETRQGQIDQFNASKGSYDAFLISTRAGGLGINLTAADSVVLFDSDWNPQVDLQAMDRTHRIGQTKPVVIYRFCCDNTVEHVILTRAASKRRLEKMVIQMGKFSNLKRLAGNEQSFISGMSGTGGRGQRHQVSSNKELMNELSQLLLSGESSIGFSRGLDDGKLTTAELNELLDRSPKSFKSERAEAQWPHIRLFETTNSEQ
ncbi:LAME_0A02586g1_1 [Lachancea meyersii CBS 8951]|uniref:LAME_0A02586g1_1 n=1 Tax=Lachancea meyersii CBS 8951 TaxID=1266667 RepID=A0A1G4IMM0_9SACH|nr:LAME_0A02586g1_1 [Lachancea meyersii CBS 8951]